MSAGAPTNFSSSASLSTTKVRTPGVDRLGDLARLLDGVRVDDAPGVDAVTGQQIEFVAGGDVEAAAVAGERLDDGVVREGLDRVVEADERQRVAQAPVLPADALGVEQQHRSPVDRDRRASGVGGEQCGSLGATEFVQRPGGAPLAPGDRLGHATLSRRRRPSRSPALSVTVNAPAAIA